ncbi:SPRY domain-containing protein [Sodiomyces alkalinus F11]|uniref:SPRY domain-containing protein n=1 Tax=Sodiomyces alkalinus (strain CBS 110278 / VKM F-3762 / F11) TaxID=1314773 RepID=A0A3N2PLC1_SODAK|nr:SPRY domain-containing protein [Sodiomyces alkalinus F11]ROT35323.1 SPRY domain-containing protein [Sodiomyces alkalinus F11]
MTSPYQSGSQGFPGSAPSASNSGSASQRRFPYASVASGAAPGSTPPYLTHPGRTSVISQLLNRPEDTDIYSPSTPFQNASRNHNPRTGSEEDEKGTSSFLAVNPSWARDLQLASFSKAFDVFTNRAVLDGDMLDTTTTGFFIPSYLQGSTFMERLIDAYKAKMRTKRETRGAQGRSGGGRGGGGNLSKNASSASLHNMAVAHRGLSYDVVEKPPPSDQDEFVSPLPSKLNKDDKYGALELSPDGMEVKLLGTKGQPERDREAFAIRADNYMPPQCGLYYFEVTILAGKRDDTLIGIGFSGKSVALSRPPGWEPDSYGYHGDDGNCHAAHNGGRTYGPSFTAQDVIGCGVNFRTGCGFFTKNGVLLGTAFKDIKGKYYPTISLKKVGEHVRVNFGQEPFVYDIDSTMATEKETILTQIEDADVSSLTSPAMNETNFIQALVLQFLQHDGYVETARAFAEEIHEEKKALNPDPNAPIEDIPVRDDEHASKRQRACLPTYGSIEPTFEASFADCLAEIRKAVLEGDIDRALKQTNAFYPGVLKDNEQVYFRLRCRKFVEMVRTAAEIRSAMETKKYNGIGKHNGHVDHGLGGQEMDVDMNGTENGGFDRMETEASVADTRRALEDLELATLQYGQALRAEFATDPRREVAKALGDIYALLAYENPLQERELAHLLDKKGRAAVAEELNSAILLSLGQSSRAAIEELYAQTSLLLEDLREGGGAGSFISVREVTDAIPPTQNL